MALSRARVPLRPCPVQGQNLEGGGGSDRPPVLCGPGWDLFVPWACSCLPSGGPAWVERVCSSQPTLSSAMGRSSRRPRRDERAAGAPRPSSAGAWELPSTQQPSPPSPGCCPCCPTRLPPTPADLLGGGLPAPTSLCKPHGIQGFLHTGPTFVNNLLLIPSPSPHLSEPAVFDGDPETHKALSAFAAEEVL